MCLWLILHSICQTICPSFGVQGSLLAMSILHIPQRRAFCEIPGVCWQVASEHVPKGGNDYVTIAYVPLKGEQ